jgi:ABC-type uncharacterized transport system auxiliary subunit
MKRLLLSTLILGGLLGLNCSKSAVVRKYYMLEAQHNPTDDAMTPLQPMSIKVDVRDFSVAKAFDQTRIVLRTKSNELNYYYYHLWAVRPATAAADMYYEILARLRLFQRCTRGYSIGPDYYISGQITAIERTLIARNESVHLMASFSLFDARTELPVLHHSFDRTVELKKDKSMNGFADAASKLLHSEMIGFTQQIIDFYQNDTP